MKGLQWRLLPLCMRIQFCSDLHLEFPENATYLRENPIQPIADILIIAGDLVPFSQLPEHHQQIEEICKPFEQVFWLPGNHEYYYADMLQKSGSFTEVVLPNLTLLNNQSITVENTELIFSTLWTHISPEKSFAIQSRLSDFFLIKKNNHSITVDDYNHLHQTSLKFIKDALENSQDKKQVVITHHCPTFQQYPEQYKKSPINEAFAVELEKIVAEFQPFAWLYGHTHINTPEFQLGKTRLTTNQLGYVRRAEHRSFNHQKFIDI